MKLVYESYHGYRAMCAIYLYLLAIYYPSCGARVSANSRLYSTLGQRCITIMSVISLQLLATFMTVQFSWGLVLKLQGTDTAIM